MRKSTIRASIPALVLSAAAAVPAGSALAASATQKYKGAAEQTQWGPVQVTITVKNKKIINVAASVGSHTARSTIIDSSALPILKSEVLQAQTANINQVSGATTISSAYIQSLQSAINSARQHRSLK